MNPHGLFKVVLTAALTVCFVLAPQRVVVGQETVLPELQPGPYAVGFRFVQLTDSTRAYDFDPVLGVQARPISVFMWYPAVAPETAQPMRVAEYSNLITLRTGSRSRTEQAKRAAQLAFLHPRAEWWTDATLAGMLQEGTSAFQDAPEAPGRFPIIVYGPGLFSEAYENSGLAEYLTSHGFVLVSTHAVGRNARWLTRDFAGVETEARDMEVMLGFARSLSNVDPHRVALMGFSWGGFANLLVQMRNPFVRAVISLDGSINWNHDQFLKPTGFSQLERVNVPFLSLRQERAPMDSLRVWGDDTTSFFDSLNYSEAYEVQFHHLNHSDFAYGPYLCRESGITPPDPESAELKERSCEAIVTYVHRFLDTYLLEDDTSRAFLDQQPEAIGLPPGLATIRRREPDGLAPTFTAFRSYAGMEGLAKADSLLGVIRERDPDWSLPEWDLIAWSWILLGDLYCEEAAGVLRMTIVLYPESAQAHSSLGDVYLQLNEPALARSSFERALEINAENKLVKERLEDPKVSTANNDDRVSCASQ